MSATYLNKLLLATVCLLLASTGVAEPRVPYLNFRLVRRLAAAPTALGAPKKWSELAEHQPLIPQATGADPDPEPTPTPTPTPSPTPTLTPCPRALCTPCDPSGVQPIGTACPTPCLPADCTPCAGGCQPAGGRCPFPCPTPCVTCTPCPSGVQPVGGLCQTPCPTSVCTPCGTGCQPVGLQCPCPTPAPTPPNPCNAICDDTNTFNCPNGGHCVYKVCRYLKCAKDCKPAAYVGCAPDGGLEQPPTACGSNKQQCKEYEYGFCCSSDAECPNCADKQERIFQTYQCAEIDDDCSCAGYDDLLITVQGCPSI